MRESAAFPVLGEGRTVSVIAPSSACSPVDFDSGVELLRSWGLSLKIPRDIFSKSSGFSANSDAVRWRHLRAALTDSDTRLIWCARGGYGALRLMDRLDDLPVPSQRKLLVGFSDITALQHYVWQKWRWPALHAPVICQLGRKELRVRDLAELKRVIAGRQADWRFAGLLPLNSAARRRRRDIIGPLVGGNLKTLQSLLGTPWSPDYPDHILFLEDVNERGYAVDRMLVQMVAAKFFVRTKALVFGSFVGGREPNGRELGSVALKEFARGVRFPVFSGLPVGHGRRFRPMPVGLSARLSCREVACLNIPG